MKSLLKLNFKAWILSPGPYFVFFFSLMMMILMGQFIPLATLMPIMIVTNTMSIALWSFGQNFMELKSSVIIKRIGVTPLSKGAFLWTTLLFSFIIIVLGGLWIVALTFGFQFLTNNGIGIVPDMVGIGSSPVPNDLEQLSSVNWTGFVTGFVINAILSLVIAFFFISISKGNEMYGLYTNLYYFLASFGGGLFIPSQAIIANSEVLSFLSWITPTAYINEYLIGTIHGYSLTSFEYTITPEMMFEGIVVDGNTSTNVGSMPPGVTGDVISPGLFDFQDPIVGASGVQASNEGMYIGTQTLNHYGTDGNVDMTTYYNTYFYYTHSIGLDVIIPLACIVVLALVSLRTFKWAK